MSFKTKGYGVIKKAISKELADFCYNYFLIKRSVADTFFTQLFDHTPICLNLKTRAHTLNYR